MALSVATNIGAIAANKAASAVNRSMETSMQRLSTGTRINAARDDSAGLAIASRLTSESRGLDQAMRNSADAQAMIDTIESLHSEVNSMLQRIRELAVQASNDTNSTADRSNIATEITALAAEIDAIASNTKWAGNSLVTASTTFAYQIGDETDETMTVTTSAIAASSLHVTGTTALTTAAEFTSLIDKVDSAIADVASYRADYGAKSNRLDHNMSHLATNSQSVKASLSRIQDTDYAAETTNLAKTQILQQAATSMLAQANASKQTILSLIQG
jgi:flagellin